MDEREEFIRDAIGAEAYQPEAETETYRYALRAIEERRELLAALREVCQDAGLHALHGAQAVIAKCEAP